MGDLRNKFAKQEYLAAVQAMQRKLSPCKPVQHPTCRCGLTIYQTTLYSHTEVKLSRQHLNGLYCLVCMPSEVKMELIDIMVTQGIPYDAAEHGEK